MNLESSSWPSISSLVEVSLVDLTPMAHSIKEQRTAFDIKPNPIISHSETPSPWTRFPHEFLAIFEWVDQQLGFDRF